MCESIIWDNVSSQKCPKLMAEQIKQKKARWAHWVGKVHPQRNTLHNLPLWCWKRASVKFPLSGTIWAHYTTPGALVKTFYVRLRDAIIPDERVFARRTLYIYLALSALLYVKLTQNERGQGRRWVEWWPFSICAPFDLMANNHGMWFRGVLLRYSFYIKFQSLGAMYKKGVLWFLFCETHS